MKFFAKYQQVIGEINWYAFLAFLAVLPYSHSLSRPVWMVWLVSWLLECRFIARPAAFTDSAERRKLVPFVGLAVWFLWGAVSVLWAENLHDAQGALMRNFDLFFLLFPALWGLNGRYNWQTCLKVFVASCLISVFVYLFAHYWVMNHLHAVNRYHKFYFSFDWLHLTDFTLNLKHRLQYTTLLSLCFPSVILLAKENVAALGRVRTFVFAALAFAVLLLAVHWTGSREGLINTIVVFSTAAVLALPASKRLWGMLAVVALAALAAFGILKFHPRFNEVPLKEYFRITDDPIRPSVEPRYAIWHTALEHPEEYSLHGVGVGQCSDYLLKKYENYGWIMFIERRYHSHNQYLCTWIELGFAAMLFFLLIWISVPFAFQGRARYFAIFFTEILMLDMCTDNMLSGIEGIFFTAAGLLILLVIPPSRPASPVQQPAVAPSASSRPASAQG